MLCPVTGELRTAAFRVMVEPTAHNGLRALSQVMVDKLSTLPRSKLKFLPPKAEFLLSNDLQ